MHTTIEKRVLSEMIASTVRNNRGMLPQEMADEIMKIVWKEIAHLDFEYRELLKEQSSVV